MKYGCVPAVVSRAEEVPDLVDERLLVVLGHPGSRKLKILIKVIINIFYYINIDIPFRGSSSGRHRRLRRRRRFGRGSWSGGWPSRRTEGGSSRRFLKEVMLNAHYTKYDLQGTGSTGPYQNSGHLVSTGCPVLLRNSFMIAILKLCFITRSLY